MSNENQEKEQEQEQEQEEEQEQPTWEKYLAPMYPYNKGIAPPEGSIKDGGLGMSPIGSLEALADNVAGLVSYGQLLISGGGRANKNVHEK